MIGTSIIQHDEYTDYFVLPDTSINPIKTDEEIPCLLDLELYVTDSTTGKPIPKAMISIDSISRTAVCDNQGKVLMQEITSGYLNLDVIVWGYKASSFKVFLSGRNKNLLHVKMIRHC